MKKIIALILVCCMTFGMLPATAFGADIVASGYCGGEGDGTNLTWKLDSDGVLTISGTGRMKDYTYGYWRGDSVKSVVIENGVTSIGVHAFYECYKLVDVSIPSSVTSIDGSSFKSCSALTSINVDASNAYYKSVNGVLFSKDGKTLVVYPAGKSGAYSIPNSVTCIGKYAFFWCFSLTSLTIPDSVTCIGKYAFVWCCSLTSLTIPDSVTSIEAFAFDGCTSLTSVTIPNSVTSIGEFAFSQCRSLTSITIPKSVMKIENCTFYHCETLASVTISNGVTSIGQQAFSMCDNLTSVTIPNSVTSIDGSSFGSCDALTSINVDASNAYYKSVNGVLFSKDGKTLVAYPAGKSGAYSIPNSVTTIGSSAFGYCTSLTSVTIPNSVTSIEEFAFNGCSSLTSITIPNSVTSIGYGAFQNCTGLTSITIPNSVTSIGYGAFQNCTGLTSVTIPNSVTSIGNDAFLKCPNLTIYGYTGSTAETYAKENDIPFVALDEETTATEPIQEWTMWNTTLSNFYLTMRIDGAYELGNGKLQIRDYESDSLVVEIPKENIEVYWDEERPYVSTETFVDVGPFNYDFDYDTKYYLTATDGFLVRWDNPESSLNSKYFTDKKESCWRTIIDAWKDKNLDGAEAAIDKNIFQDVYGTIEGSLVYSKNKDAGLGGLCAGFVLSAWTFYLDKVSPGDFDQTPTPTHIREIKLDSTMKKVKRSALTYIKRAFVLQYAPDIQKQKEKNMGDIVGLYSAVIKSQSTGDRFVYISIPVNTNGAHALWGYAVDKFKDYSIIYAYDCNHPNEVCELYLYGSYPNFTSVKVSHGALYGQIPLNISKVTFFSGLDEITEYIINDDDIAYIGGKAWNLIATDSSRFNVSKSNGETATYNDGDVAGDSDIIIPISSTDTGEQTQNSTEAESLYWIAGNTIFETENTTSGLQSFQYASNGGMLNLNLNADDRIVVDATASDNEMMTSMYVNSPDNYSLTYTLLIDDQLVNVAVEGLIEEEFSSTEYKDSIVISGIKNPTITMDDGNNITQRTIDSNDNDSVEIVIRKTDDDYEMDIDVTTEMYTITFDGNGGIPAKTAVTTNTKGQISNLPTATRVGYAFDGWYTDPVNGTQITTSTVFTSNATVYAHWTKEPASGFDKNSWYRSLTALYSQEFDVTAFATEGGTITPAGVSTVKYDKSIAYTITPDEGYAIADVLVDGKSIGAVAEYTINHVKKAHTVMAIFVKIAWENPYTDVSENEWYYADVEFVSERDLMIGTSDNTFSPDAIVNRAMLITVLWRLEGSPTVSAPMTFADVPDDEWYAAAVKWATAAGIVNGYGDGIFGTRDDLTHEQIMAILNRYAVYKKWSETVSGNTETVYNNSEWAISNVLWADRNGLFDGIGSDISDLTEGADRAELAAYLRRFCERFMAE